MGEITGKGIYKSANDGFYEGELLNGKRHGWGTNNDTEFNIY